MDARGYRCGITHGDKRLPIILAAAEAHKNEGLAAVTGKHYEGGTKCSLIVRGFGFGSGMASVADLSLPHSD
jgi:hypothetical protein